MKTQVTQAPARIGPSVHSVLLDATRAQHGAVNVLPQMKRLFADDYTRAEYGEHLVRSLGFFEPLEAAAAVNVGEEAAAHCVWRSQALRDDLADLGYTPQTLAGIERCEQLPRLSPAVIWGYFYVSLGSMLGGVMIARRLRRVLGQSAPLRFYDQGSGHGDARWTAFCVELEGHAADSAAIALAANATFDAYAAWMQPHV